MGWTRLLLISSVFLTSVFSVRAEYLGCFKDSSDKRMFGYMTDYPSTLTPSVCIEHCKRFGYGYAGLQYRSQCFCGNDEPNIKLKVDEDDCGQKCSGDNTEHCGGDWRNSVYKAGNVVKAVVAVIDFAYMGCYRDQEYPRSLQGIFKDFGDYLTPLQCVQFCKQMGYLYAGLQYSSQCFCGDQSLPDNKKLDEKECSSKCSGDITTICGGGWKNTVYATGLTQVSTVANIGYKYEGCYRDTEIRRLNAYMKDFGEFMIPEECVTLCKRYGYRFAGLQYRSQCFCGDLDLIPSEKRPESECNYKCSGDITKLCGAGFRNTVYNTGITGDASVAETGYPYLGCYKDSDNNRRIKGDFKDFGEDNSPEICVNFCSDKGYKYAGLQYSSQCFCGDRTPLSKDKVEDRECASRCTGDKSYYCGAGWRNTVYHLQSANATVAQFNNQYLGCYLDTIEPRKLNGKLQLLGINTIPMKCIDFCLKEGFKFAGLQDSQNCYCGNTEPLPSDKKDDSECNSRCLGDNTKICGGKFRNTIYKTNVPAATLNKTPVSTCEMAVTTVNGKPTCKGQVIFNEDFLGTSLSDKWSHVVKIAGEPDSEFVIFKPDPSNSYVKDGKLVIKPTLLEDSFIQRGKVELSGCTGKVGTEECEYQARIYLILPPVESARLNTHNGFSFRYGRVDIKAKLPKGDWLVPDIWLENKDNTYGPNYSSGRIRIAMSRGNQNLTSKDSDLSCKLLEVGIVMGVENNIRELTSGVRNSECWSDRFHEYSVLWTHNNISFYVDGIHMASMLKPGDTKLRHVIGFSNDISALWSVGSNIAPFDSDFYITLGLSAGGVRNFPDGASNAGRLKPWKNSEPKRTLNFWKERQRWEPTWKEDPTLQIDYIKVTAI